MKIIKNTGVLGEVSSARMNNSLTPMSMLMKGPHTLGTLYIPNLEMSRLIDGTDSVQTWIGEDSTILFDKIDNMIFMGVEDIIINCTFDDQLGSIPELKGSLLIFSETANVRENSYFTLDVIDKPYLFKIINYTNNTLASTPTIAVEFELAHTDKSKLDMLKKQVNKDYIICVNKIGQDDSFAIEKTAFYSRKQMAEEYIDLCRAYQELFYEKRVSFFAFKSKNAKNEEIQCIDMLLQNFMYQNKIVVYDPVVTFAVDSLSLRYEGIFMDLPKLFDTGSYFKSIYTQFFKKRLSSSDCLRTPNFIDMNSQISRNFKLKTHLANTYMNALTANHEYDIFTDEFILQITSGSLYTENSNVADWRMKNIIIQLYHNKISDMDFTTVEISFERSYANYYLIPWVLLAYQRKITSIS